MSQIVEITTDAHEFLAKHHTHFINGEAVASTGTSRIDVINPATGAVISSIADATKSDVDAAVDAARKAFEHETWRDMKPAHRASLLSKYADTIEAHADELAMLEVIDGGKPLMLAKPVDVMATIGAFRYYAGWADNCLLYTSPSPRDRG